ncbi:MAG: hypothetical protein ACN4GM_00745 [Gammaproteobacteria bacterium]
MIEMAENQTANVKINSINAGSDNHLIVDVEVENLTGNFLPSGVGFGRIFVETIVYDKDNKPIWASGRTNELGVILKGRTGLPLLTEQGGQNKTEYQPHYQLISTED